MPYYGITNGMLIYLCLVMLFTIEDNKIFQFQRSEYEQKQVGFLFLGLVIESLSQRGFHRGYQYPVFSEDPEPPNQRLYPVPYAESSQFIFRKTNEERREIDEANPLCEEIRKSQSIDQIIKERRSKFTPAARVDLSRYKLTPGNVNIIECAKREVSGSPAVCKPENCKERKVDIEVFGRLRNQTANIWQFIGVQRSVPIACECFVLFKPEKCTRSVDIFSDF